MADSRESQGSASDAGSSSNPLAERVRNRLADAGRAFDRRAKASRPPRRRREDAGTPGAPDPHHTRERACLRAVFHELGAAHRKYRIRTGNTVTPALREATTAFKQEPSVLSLVPVVAFLDELGILPW